MHLRLDPRFPIVWRSPTTIQIGVDGEPVVLEGVTPPVEHLLGAVTAGVSDSRLRELGALFGLRTAEVDDFIALVRPVLHPGDPITQTREACAVDGTGLTADLVRLRLRDAGVAVSSGPRGSTPVALAVIVASFAIAPARYVRWLSLDIPHLAVVYTDTGVTIGPLVEPGIGPCLHCVANARVDADEAWPTLASQLAARAAVTEREPLVGDVVARVVRLVTARLHKGANELAGASISLAETSVAGRLVAHRQHPRCGCRSLSESATSAEAALLGLTPLTTT